MKTAWNQMPQGYSALLAPAMAIATGVVLLACVALAVRAVLLLVAPASLPIESMTAQSSHPMARPATSYQPLTIDPFHRNAAISQPRQAAPDTSLDLKLVGIRTGQPGSTILQFSDGRQQVFQTGDKVLEGVKLEAIAADHVILNRRGVRERLGFAKTASSGLLPTGTDQGVYRLPASDWARFAGAVSLERSVQNGKILGWKIQPRNSSFNLSQIGLAPGDILVRVGNEDLRQGRPELDRIAAALSRQSAVTIEFMRNGREMAVKVGSS